MRTRPVCYMKSDRFFKVLKRNLFRTYKDDGCAFQSNLIPAI